MIDWSKVYKLKASEFPEDPDLHADPSLIYALGGLRSSLKDELLLPSPARGALARFDGSKTSQHYAVGRFSTACDIFCTGVPNDAYKLILANPFFKGIGIYLDTKGPDGLPWIMFHVDIRRESLPGNKPLVWIVKKEINPVTHKKADSYYYPHKDHNLWDLLNASTFFKNKQYGIS